jgi:hypothetical protein
MSVLTAAFVFAGVLALFAVAYYGLELTRTTNRALTSSRLVVSAGLVFLNTAELLLHSVHRFELLALATAITLIVAGLILRRRSTAA